MRIFGFFALIFVLAGCAFLYSRTLPHMTDQAGFDAAYEQLKDSYYQHHLEHMAASDAYYKLYREYVTPRNDIKKYSLTAMVLAAGGMLLFCRSIKGLKTPPNKWLLVPVALFATGLTIWGSLADIDEAFGRGDVPEWSNLDKGGIGVLFVFPVLCAIGVILDLALIAGRDFTSPVPVFPLPVKRANPIIAALLLFTLAWTAFAAWDGGAYFALIATPFWLYFHASALAIRAKGRQRLVI